MNRCGPDDEQARSSEAHSIAASTAENIASLSSVCRAALRVFSSNGKAPMTPIEMKPEHPASLA
jgi:hypothetical protein